MLNIHIVTHQPEYYPGPLLKGILGKSYLLDYTLRWYKLTGNFLYDKPYGHSVGLCMRIDILDTFLRDINLPNDTVYIIPSPDGYPLEKKITTILSQKNICFICPRYTGLDYRFYKLYSVLPISIGNYIISNGDLATIVILDSCLRLLYLRNKTLALQYDTTYNKLYTAPIYTKPQIYNNLQVPLDYLTGHALKIKNLDFITSI